MTLRLCHLDTDGYVYREYADRRLASRRFTPVPRLRDNARPGETAARCGPGATSAKQERHPDTTRGGAHNTEPTEDSMHPKDTPLRNAAWR